MATTDINNDSSTMVHDGYPWIYPNPSNTYDAAAGTTGTTTSGGTVSFQKGKIILKCSKCRKKIAEYYGYRHDAGECFCDMCHKLEALKE